MQTAHCLAWTIRFDLVWWAWNKATRCCELGEANFPFADVETNIIVDYASVSPLIL